MVCYTLNAKDLALRDVVSRAMVTEVREGRGVDAKILAAEALHGVVGLVFVVHGNRFANEVGKRDYVSGELLKNKPPFRLALNKATFDVIAWHCKHYTVRTVTKFYESGAALAPDMGVPVSKMWESIEARIQASLKTVQDLDGGPFPAYHSGKSWDKTSEKTGLGKNFYHSVNSGADFVVQPLETLSEQSDHAPQADCVTVDSACNGELTNNSFAFDKKRTPRARRPVTVTLVSQAR